MSVELGTPRLHHEMWSKMPLAHQVLPCQNTVLPWNCPLPCREFLGVCGRLEQQEFLLTRLVAAVAIWNEAIPLVTGASRGHKTRMRSVTNKTEGTKQ